MSLRLKAGIQVLLIIPVYGVKHIIDVIHYLVTELNACIACQLKEIPEAKLLIDEILLVDFRSRIWSELIQ